MSEPAGVAGIWRNRDFVLVWSAQALSDLGTGLSQLAYPLLMLAITGSPAQAGALAAVRALPYALFGLAAGALTDRWNRRRVMIACDAVRALAMLSVPLAVFADGMSAGQLYVVAAVSGTAYVFFSAAESGALPNVVPAHQLGQAVSAQEVSSSTTGIVSSPLGGALFGLARGLPFLIDAISFAASAFALSAVRSPFRSPDRAASDDEGLITRVTAGLRWLFRHPVLGPVAALAALLQVAISGVGLVVILDARSHGASSALVGLVLAAVGVGGVLGASVAARIKRRLGLTRTLQGTVLAQTGLWIVLAISPTLWLTAADVVMFAATMPIFGVAVLTYQMEQTPDELRGRVGTAFGLLTWGATPLGAAAAGELLDHVSTSTTALVFAGWTATVALVSGAVLNRKRHHLGDSTIAEPQPSGTTQSP